MLEVILSALVKIGQLLFADRWVCLVLNGLKYLLVQIVAHVLDWLWIRQCGDLFHQFVTVHPLLLGLLKQERFWLKIEDTLVSFVC